MEVVEHRPPAKIDDDLKSPAIFLAGPIQGAPDWQSRALHSISSCAKMDVSVFNPRRSNNENFDYKEQVGWELEQLARARDFGAIIFWFAKQDHSLEYPTGRAYTQTTRFEMGLACGWKDYNPDVSMSVGIEEGYVGGNENYIKFLASRADVEVFSSLGAVCLDAVSLATERKVNG